MDILDIFGHFYLNHLSPLWGYLFFNEQPSDRNYVGKIWLKIYLMSLKIPAKPYLRLKTKTFNEPIQAQSTWSHTGQEAACMIDLGLAPTNVCSQARG